MGPLIIGKKEYDRWKGWEGCSGCNTLLLYIFNFTTSKNVNTNFRKCKESCGNEGVPGHKEDPVVHWEIHEVLLYSLCKLDILVL